MGMSSSACSEAAWIVAIDLAACDTRFGKDQVDRVLQDPRDHAEPPHVDDAGRLSAALIGPISVRVRLQKEGLEITCSCSRGRPYVCEHVVRVIVDLAVHPLLR